MAAVAAQHDIGIQVLFSHSSDHYIRVYAQIGYGCQKADEALKSTGYILHCFSCMHREITHQPFGCLTCPECGAKMDYAGPLWTGSILDAAFIEQMIKENQATKFKNNKKIAKMLDLLKGEASMPATYYVIDKLSGKLTLPAPSNQEFLAALKAAGYMATATHFNPRGIKTDAPALAMHKILRELTVNK
jgi:tRNA (guanine26-N2/guanine27-N2)-dimethyltransferase